MPRYKLTIEYDGTLFVGWQAQDNGVSVQAVLTDAIAAFTGERVVVGAAGRTDAGVHALGPGRACRSRQGLGMRDRAGRHQFPPAPAAGRGTAPPNARRRTSTPGSPPSNGITFIASSIGAPILTLDQNRAWRVPRPLNAEAMHAAAQRLVGRHDFTTFRVSRVPGQIAGKDARSPRRRAQSAKRSSSAPRRALSCSTRCDRWSVRWCMSAKESGAPMILPPRSPRAIAPRAVKSPHRKGYI